MAALSMAQASHTPVLPGTYHAPGAPLYVPQGRGEGAGGHRPTVPAALLFPPGAPTVDAAAAAVAARRAGERPAIGVDADVSVGNTEADAATAVAQVAAPSAAVGHRCRRRHPRRRARPQRPTPHRGSFARRAAAAVATARAARARPLGAAARAAAAAPTAGVWSTGVPQPGTLRQPLRPRDTAAVGSTAARA